MEKKELITDRVPPIHAIPTIDTHSRVVYRFIKRTVDILISGIFLAFMLPIFGILFIFYHTGKDKGPMFYKQQRVGKNGKLFYMYKFRSMVINADKILHSDPELYQLYVQNNYKLDPKDDKRITAFGRFLRKSSIDELPQFLNIFKGEMSLVGPRPVIKEELKEFGAYTDEFLSVTPGAMGYWQAHGRSNIPYPYRVNYEVYYVENANLLLDIKIILKNIVSIFKQDGAY